MGHRPTRRAVTVAVVAGLLFAAASTAQAGWLYVLAAGVLGMVVGSFLARHDLRAAEVQRTVPSRVAAGDDVRVTLSVANGGRRSLPLLRVEDRFDAFEPVVVVSRRLARGRSMRVELLQGARHRGVFESGDVLLRTGAPFGFLTSTRTASVRSPMTVVPRHVDLRSVPILEPSSYPSDVLHERARTGAGQEYLGVREYRPGDPLRSVHWRSTARAGRLVVREFEEEVATRVSLILTGADEGEPPDSLFEALVSAAASVAIYALQTGHPVDLLRWDGAEPLHLGDPDRYAVLDWLAAAAPVDLEPGPLVAQAIDRTGRRGTIVLLAPTSGRAGAGLSEAVRLVQSAGCRAIVVAGIAGSWSIDRPEVPIEEEMLSKLAAGRAAIRSISRGQDLAAALQ